MRKANLFIKRLIDFFGSLIGVTIISPLFIIIALVIKMTSKGPIFFKQERLGKDGKIFKIIKFRTMVVNAEKIGAGLFVFDEKDKRITKVGNFLRNSSLDELPQLINILRGEMSLVGPRPPVTYHPYKIEDYDSHKNKRFLVRPGITGLAQIKLRNSGTWDERIEYDIEYVEKLSIFLDIKILFYTCISVLLRKNIVISGSNEEILLGREKD